MTAIQMSERELTRLRHSAAGPRQIDLHTEGSSPSPALAASAASAAGLSGRIGADRRLRACLVRGPWRCVHAAGVCRRRNQPVMTLRLVVSELAFDYFRTTRAYLEIHGKPVAFCSDKHNIFRVNNGEGGNRVTQFGRAPEALNERLAWRCRSR